MDTNCTRSIDYVVNKSSWIAAASCAFSTYFQLEEEMQSQFDLRDALQDIVSDAGFNDEGVRDWLEEKQQIWADMETRH